MGETVVAVWSLAVAFVGLNGFAAGIVAVLHAWRSRMRQGGRVGMACLAAGSLPASIFAVVGFAESFASDPGTWALVVAGVFAVAAVISLPAAILVSRRLERPRTDYQAFE